MRDIRHVFYCLPPWRHMVMNFLNTKYPLNRIWLPSDGMAVGVDRFMH